MNNWLNKNEYPFNSNYFHINGHRLHYIDAGHGEVLLFVHGTPSWSFDFRNVIKVLSKEFRCIAIDHIGFGLSDKPQNYDYSTQHHCLTLEKFILSMGLKEINLVVHDFGGPIGINFALNHPQSINKIIMLNTWMWSSEGDPAFNKLKKILKSPLLPFLYKYLNFSPGFILPASFGDNKLSFKLKRQFTKPFRNASQRNGPLTFAYSLLNDQHWFQQLWDKRYILMDKPILLIWGMKDPVLSPEYLEKFVSGFPLSKFVKIESAGHFPQEEQPEKVADSIAKFMR